ncbi:MAG: hypothetical protein JXN65_03415 [Clostridia bacterium]|nr:hypothetical protein [Clostridia bacterium]
MKKRNVVVVVLVIALLLMGSAYALWTDSVTVNVTAQSATMDVLINYRSVSVAPTGSLPVVTDIGTPSPAVIDAANTTDAVQETITNFIPGDTVTLTYRIINDGTIDVLLTGFNISFAGTSVQDLQADTHLTWTMTGFVGGLATDTATGSGQLNAIATTVDVEASGAVIEIPAGTADYCELTLVFYINDSTGIPYSTVKETVFTVEPVFRQN